MPFSANITFQVPQDTSGANGALVYIVPTGKLLIVDYVSAETRTGIPDDIFFSFYGVQGNAIAASHVFGATVSGTAGAQLTAYAASQQTRIMFGSGASLYADINRSVGPNTKPSLFVVFNISGRLLEEN